MYIFLCEDNIDGIFTGIYDAWASKYGHANISLTTCPPDNYVLFCEYITVQTDYGKSQKVARTLQKPIQNCAKQPLLQKQALAKRKPWTRRMLFTVPLSLRCPLRMAAKY